MSLQIKIGMAASCVMLLGVFLPTTHWHDHGAKFFITYIFANPYPALIISSAVISFLAAKKENHRLLWGSSIIGTLIVLSAFYSAWSSTNLLTDGYELLRKYSPNEASDHKPPHLGIGWLFMITGSLGVLLSAAMSVKDWGLGSRIEAILSETKGINMKTTKPRISWDEWGIGGKLIFCATCLGMFSFLLPWVDLGFTSRNGLSQGGFLLGAFYIYPVYKLLTSQTGSRTIGLICAALAVIFAFAYIGSKTVEVFNETVNAASAGVDVFIIASLLLGVGVWMRDNELNRQKAGHSDEHAAGMLDTDKPTSEDTVGHDEGRIPCPRCAELIMPNAKVCRFCGSNLSDD